MTTQTFNSPLTEAQLAEVAAAMPTREVWRDTVRLVERQAEQLRVGIATGQRAIEALEFTRARVADLEAVLGEIEQRCPGEAAILARKGLSTARFVGIAGKEG